jgi:hypothetical protein
VKALGLSALQVWNFLLGNNKSNPESSLRELNEVSQSMTSMPSEADKAVRIHDRNGA